MTNGFRILFAVLLMQTASYADSELFWPHALQELQSVRTELSLSVDDIQARASLPRNPKCLTRYSQDRSRHQDRLNHLYLAFVQDLSRKSVRKNMGDTFGEKSSSEVFEIFITAFVQNGLDIKGLNWYCDLSDKLFTGTHALGVAQLHKGRVIIKALVQKGADINRPDDDDARPLSYALELKDPGMAEFLVANGARLTGSSYLKYMGTESLLANMLYKRSYLHLARKSWFKTSMRMSNWAVIAAAVYCGLEATRDVFKFPPATVEVASPLFNRPKVLFVERTLSKVTS